MESDLEDNIDELMNDSDNRFIFEKEVSEKDAVSDYQLENILMPEANIHAIEDRRENPEDSEKGSQEDEELLSRRVRSRRVGIPEAKEKPKGH